MCFSLILIETVGERREGGDQRVKYSKWSAVTADVSGGRGSRRLQSQPRPPRIIPTIPN